MNSIIMNKINTDRVKLKPKSRSGCKYSCLTSIQKGKKVFALGQARTSATLVAI